MEELFITCFFIDLIIQLVLLFLLWRLIKGIRWADGKSKLTKQPKLVSRSWLLSFQIASVVVVFLLAFIVSYGSGESLVRNTLLMFVLFLAMPMHGGILISTTVLNRIYKKKEPIIKKMRVEQISANKMSKITGMKDEISDSKNDEIVRNKWKLLVIALIMLGIISAILTVVAWTCTNMLVFCFVGIVIAWASAIVFIAKVLYNRKR